ncbi:MAG: FIST signal transduction protein [Syntrophobacteraceae bacterium]
MKAGSGYSPERASLAAGVDATQKALASGDLTKPDFLFAFCSGKLDPDDFFKGIQTVVGAEAPVIGGSAIGIIANDHLSYDGYASGVAAIKLDSVSYQIASANGLANNGKYAGEKLIENLANPTEGSGLLIFYDSLNKPAEGDMPPVMNPSSRLIEGIENRLGSNIPILGAGLLSDFEFRNTPKQFCGSCVAADSVVSVLPGRGIKLYSRIMHGCTPLDGIYHRITRSDGAVIYEIDDQPAVEMIDALYENREWRGKHPIDLLTIGVNHGAKFAPPDEACYVNRLITGALPDGSGIGIFEPDLEPGTEIQFMLRDSSKMIESARENSRALMNQIENEKRTARFGLYIDCAGRTAALSNTPAEEAVEVQNVMNQYGVPLLGFYSGVEIAPFLQKSRGLDWTGVLIIFAE